MIDPWRAFGCVVSWIFAILFSYAWLLLVLAVSGCQAQIDHGLECWALVGKSAAIEAWQTRAVDAGHNLLTKEDESEIINESVFLISQSDAQERRDISVPVKAFHAWDGIYVCTEWPRVPNGPNVPGTESELVDRVVHESMHNVWYHASNLPNDWRGDEDAWFLSTVEAGRAIAQEAYLSCQ